MKFKSGKPERGGVRSEEEETTDRHDRHDRTSEGLPQVKLLTNGSGKVWTVDENGKPLGNTTDNSAIRTQQGFQAIKERFKLLDSARKILDGERTQHCFYNRVDKNDGVGVTFNKFRNKANYTNVMRCANAWGCPVCASKITEKRKVEVKKAMDSHQLNGGGCYMLTLTIPHYMGDNLKLLLSGLSVAMKHFFNGTRKSKAIWADMGKIGHIRALEVTYGSNGWHPHFHVMIFTKEPLKSGYNLTPLIELWQNACRLAKLPIPSFEHGLDWKKGNYSEYVTKWGMESEITKGHVKQGRLGSLTAWDMLRASMFQLDPKAEKMGKLFQEFAISFKKQRQLVWSRGLKDLFNIEQVDDSDCPDHQDDQNDTIIDEQEVYFTDEQWFFIKRRKLQPELLNLAEQQGIDAIKDFLQTLPTTSIPVQLDPSLAVMRM